MRRHNLDIIYETEHLDWWSGSLADLAGTLREWQTLGVGFISRLR